MSETTALPAVKLLDGKTYPLVWGNRAKIRFASVPPELTSMEGPVYDSILVWSCIATKPNPFLTWEDVADQIDASLIEGVRATLRDVFPKATEEKKNLSAAEPSTASASD